MLEIECIDDDMIGDELLGKLHFPLMEKLRELPPDARLATWDGDFPLTEVRLPSCTPSAVSASVCHVIPARYILTRLPHQPCCSSTPAVLTQQWKRLASALLTSWNRRYFCVRQVAVCDTRKVAPPAKITLKIQWIPFTYRQTEAEAAIDRQHHGRLHGLFHHKVRHQLLLGYILCRRDRFLVA